MNLDNFFTANSIAIIGVSSDATKVGHIIFRNFVDAKYKGKVYIVNPHAEKILGYTCYKSVTDIPEKVDVAVIAVPAEASLGVITECAKKGIQDVVMVTAGFKEVGNYDLDKKLEKLLKKHKIKCVGPNCLGCFDAHSGFDTLFLPTSRLQRPGKGGISFICQSGAVGSATMDLAAKEGYGFAKFISYGNAMNVDETDLLEYLGNDKATRVICMYVEGIKDGRKFLKIAKKVSQKKPVIIIKGGVTEELFNFARIFDKSICACGPRIQVITNGGGYGILSTDAIVRSGLEMAKPSVATINEMKKRQPRVTTQNPIDLLGDA